LVERSEKNRGINPEDPIHKHESETQLPPNVDPIWDYVVDNNYTLEDLRITVGDIYNDINLRYDVQKHGL
jgi:hypothetical protein